MRAYEFIIEERRSPPITLRQLNAMKHEIRAREQSHARRNKLVAVMYTTPAEKQEAAELAQLHLDIKKQELELLAQELEIKIQYKGALDDMRKSEMDKRKRLKSQPVFGRAKKTVAGRLD